MKRVQYTIAFTIISVLAATCIACKDDVNEKLYRKQPKPEYTRDDPDVWSGMETEHLPAVTFYKDREPDIYVRVKLEKPDQRHFIERIGIMDEKRNDIVYKDFSPNTRIFEARFFSASLPKNKKLKVYAKCNLHDLWTEPLELP